ncbi:uncharacterized protein LOC125069883 [Vanessa atalanta]|uniref:uncharacterized protein LOC125069883 n=1 Tax=Vanessa atalanta TaxID=42275 RepID=UPI001FCCDCED|nr:uncharacterized protein LOC125069883 [Vanessa atalanta]
MRLFIFFFIIVISIVIVACSHTFMGTNVFRQQVHRRDVRFSPNYIRKRVENITFAIPATSYWRSIQGILAYDLTNSSATANVTAGGIGYSYVTLRLSNDRGREIHYDINIYV